MTPLSWTEPAREDLRAIHAYIARDSKVYAKRMIDRIEKRVKVLRDFPLIGWQVEEVGREDIREVSEGPYRIIYRVRENGVEILAVLHSARRFPHDLGLNDEPTT